MEKGFETENGNHWRTHQTSLYSDKPTPMGGKKKLLGGHYVKKFLGGQCEKKKKKKGS